MATRTPEPTPEMIAAGADALEHVNGIGRWLAESLATSVLQRAFEAHQAAAASRSSPAHAEHSPHIHTAGIHVGFSPPSSSVHTHTTFDCHGFIVCGSTGCCSIRCRHS